ncbi:hypothetical protein BJY21_001192 [Kineosphaera limosa]|nr:helix-turn-helix domain-containing protein [Kineosphaera limosa]NYE00008.1 hypothetical protein [Kineosphaera limosa]
MANRAAAALMLREGDRGELERLHRSTAARAGQVLRARIVLAAADGEANERIAARFQTSKATVLKWRGRYQANGLAGLADEPWTVPALVDTRLGCLGLKEFRHGFDTTALHG